eukprot:TRINITY_DN13184_c0_g1_i1.p1 TRINITY_DN13184_c0_g1~~TRINITY_DN13184_c0_g1_i1.p1  ORF type:complete len:552 (-),score=29.15 TRINITY_DN13184_c0_g1_i1:1252-2742(-)
MLGMIDNFGVRNFRKIPFARPPIGPLRFRSPQPNSPWSGLLNATTWGPPCWQTTNTYGSDFSEDCLYLNVYTPNVSHIPVGGLPVMFWIYGGGFVQGSSAVPFYDGSHIVKASNNSVIVVSVQYRVGPWGFLGSDQLRDPITNSTGNFGFEDQTLGLKWVQKNIAAFGGNASQVTVFGESAGGHSTCFHLLSPTSRGQGLYRSAIIESGPVAWWASMTLQEAEAGFNKVTSVVGCANATDKPACLRNVSNKALLKGETACQYRFRPTVDGVVFPQDPQVMARAGNFEKVPIVMGTNANEGTILIGFYEITHEITAKEYPAAVKKLMVAGGVPMSEYSTLMSLYPLDAFSSPWFAISGMFGDSLMLCPSRQTARWFANPHDSHLRMYQFTHELADAPKWKGVSHGEDVLFVFYDVYGFTAKERVLAHQFVSLWTSFAATGVPTATGVPEWPLYHNATSVHMTLDITSTVNAHLKEKQCNFWEKYKGVSLVPPQYWPH